MKEKRKTFKFKGYELSVPIVGNIYYAGCAFIALGNKKRKYHA